MKYQIRAIILLFIVCAVFVLFFTNKSKAHEWYDSDCCSGQDCRPLNPAKGETVDFVPAGVRLWDGRLHMEKTRKSGDGLWHLCEDPSEEVRSADKKIYCIYQPAMAFILGSKERLAALIDQ